MNSIRNTKRHFPIGSEPFITCAKEFGILTDTIWRTYNGKSLVFQQKWARKLSELIEQIPKHNKFVLDKEDVEQQLALYWLKWYRAWKKRNNKRLSLRGYLIRRTIFDIGEWIAREGRVVDQALIEVSLMCSETKPVDMDLHWLFYGGTELEAFKDITRYERYLLYLHFLQGKTICEISEIVFRHRNMVSKDLVNAISKIRSYYNAKEVTGGSCNGGAGNPVSV